MWLPLCLMISKPKRCKARTASEPETWGNLGMSRHLERGQQRVALLGQRKLFQVKLGCLSEMAYRLGNRITLGRSACFGVECNKTALFRRNQNGCKRHD